MVTIDVSYICADGDQADSVYPMKAIVSRGAWSGPALETPDCPPVTRQDRESSAMTLARGAVLACTGRKPMVVRCDEGRVWITHSGEPGDIILNAGESYRSRNAGRLVVESLADTSRLRLFTPIGPG